jgi:hypothetical protein
MAQMVEAGDFKETKDYYGYIRSLGDLCWRIGNQTSCEVYCEEAEQLRQFLARASSPEASTSGSFPDSDCVYTGEYLKDKTDLIKGISGMLKSVGITTPNAYAGAIGNLAHESRGLDCNVHNSRDPGGGCGSTPSRVLGTSGYGLVQWCGSRADNLAQKCGKNCSCQEQLEFIRKEIEGKAELLNCRDNFIPRMNNARSPEEAADIFDECYERSKDGAQERRDKARKIFNGLKCERRTET